MNIAVFIKKTTLHKGFGGLETQNKALCEGLVQRGHKVTIFSPIYELDKDTASLNGVSYRFVRCSFRSLAGFGHLDKNNWINRSVEEFETAQRDVPFNLVLAQSSAGLGITRRKKEFNIPVISISHGSAAGEYRTYLQSLSSLSDVFKFIPNTAYFILNFFRRQREFVLHSDKVIAVSQFVKNALKEETFIPDKKVVVIYNGIRPLSFNKEASLDIVRIFYVGLIHWSKGMGDLVEAFDTLGGQDVRLTIIGDGDHLEKLKDLVFKKDLGESIKVLGRTTHEEAMKELAASDIFVLPSRRVEGFPMTIVEAMFAAIPVVGSNMGGIPESIKDGDTGIVYESGNKEKLASALKRLVGDKNLRKKMGEAALERAKREFSLDAMLNKYEEVFNEVLE